MADILDDAREAVRQERMLALVKRYGALVLLATIVLIIGIIGWQMWQSKQRAAADVASVAYFDALEKLQAGDKAAAEAALAAIAADGPKGYRTIAALQLAAQKAEAGKTAEAIADYQNIAKHGDDPAFRELAVLLAAQLEGKNVPSTDGVWRLSALELQGINQLIAKEYAKAKESFVKISTDPVAPSGLRQRAVELILYTTYLEDNAT